LEIYFEKLKTYPTWALEWAVDSLIDSHVWGSVPKIAEIQERARKAPGYAEKVRVKSNVWWLRMHLRKFPRQAPSPAVKREPLPAPATKTVPRPMSAREAERQLQADKAVVMADIAADERATAAE
jgi:hypothetical protein